MSELAGLEAAAAPVVEAAIKALTPEAVAVVKELHDVASAEFAKLDDEFPMLLETAKTDALGALRHAESRLAAVVNAIRSKLGIQQQLSIPSLAPASTPDPTPAVPAPQQ